MINIKDLHFKEDILPLLDFLNNDHSLDVMISVFTTIPSTLEEIKERQGILKGLIAQAKMPVLPAYGRAEFNEVYSYINHFNNLSSTGHTWFGFLLNKKKRYAEAGRLTQAVLLLNKIRKSYFGLLNPSSFPVGFGQKIRSLSSFLSGLQLETYEHLSREKGLSIKDILHLTTVIHSNAGNGNWENFWNDLFLLEAYMSVATGIQKKGFQFPEFSDNEFEIQGLYHPLLKDPVKNDLPLNKNISLLTGPNMSGKSTLLKAVGLCVYMAHLGLGVPADYCKIPWFHTISVAIHHTDDIGNGYSHFMTEIKTLKQVLTDAVEGKSCFAVFDELFSGTNIEDAIDLSHRTLKGMTRFKKSYFIVSTHLHQLRDIAPGIDGDIHALYIDYRLDEGKPGYTYQLKQGWCDLKLGKIIFEQEGLDKLLD
ncbi:MAG: hypothetical protein KF746_20405 [Chitinophagaceae bacterium]|nr:hypothetical protein [Chitinophagaceae bacterium]